MTDAAPQQKRLSTAIILIVTGLLGWYASFALTLDKFAVLENPQADLDCNLSVLVQCGANLASWQGALLGFPNPVLGLGGFVAPIAVGVGLLAGATYDRWFWIAFNVGVAGALGFCIWLMSQSIFSLGTLCPWCMLVWAVTIIMFWTLTLRNAAVGVFGAGLERVGRALYSWIPALVIGSYLVVAIVAQLRLDFLTEIAIMLG
ncbi:putative membrane protein [Microbacteriaceae bacterium SG_E_30_P1]|uniref:Membrane protein n=1 Tax=Antiquaquibacter oligotrophicus TaxID=2880260 RepID=A0ABT6KPW2_9MICO|nr:vitamin K epoxide reductase family protein [Antiquaquibacter oligotrophicus]MDH6181224.1 putative membrane protein [Antiquaquibacter oligotrophicus]UDF13081.1 vitamin K epoxide reductase family protein [Antiquaquibacter oligotrophicus]